MASDSWFRFYNTATDHPKVIMLSDAHFRAWIRLLCLASKMGGTIPDNMELVARTLLKSQQKAADIVQVLLSAVLLDRVEGGYVPHNWNTKQFKSDVSTERVKAFRERSRNVSETDQRQSTETEAETEKKELPARKRASKPVVEPESFAEFWQAYPLSKARPDALKAYVQALGRGGNPEAMLAGARRYAAEMRGAEKKFIKHAGGWLRDERWKDAETAQVIPLKTSFNTPEEQELQRLAREQAYGQATN